MSKRNRKKNEISNEWSPGDAFRRSGGGDSISRIGNFVFPFIIGCLVALTVFLSGEQNERTGSAHLLAMLWLLAAAGWLASLLLSRDKRSRDKSSRPKLRFSRLDGIVYGFFAWFGVSIFWNLLPGQGGAPRPGLNMFSVWLLLAAAWFLFRQILRNERFFTVLSGVFLAVAVSQAFFGLYQQFVDIPRMIRQFEADPVATLQIAEPSVVPGTPTWDRLAARIRTAVPAGTYPLSNTLGGLLACGSVLAMGILFFRVDAFRTEKRISLAGALFIVLTMSLLIGLVLVQCRSAWVAVVVGLSLLVWGRFRKRLQYRLLSFRKNAPLSIFGVAAFVIVLVFVALSMTSGKAILSGARQSLGYRFEYWTASLGMIRDFPMFGCGSGNFKQTYTRYKLPEASEEIADPHHFAVEIAAVSGLPALLLFLIALIPILISGLGNSNGARPIDWDTGGETIDRYNRCFWGGLVGCWAAFLFSFSSEAPMDVHAPFFATIAFLATAWVVRTIEKPIPSVVFAAILVALLVHLSAAGGISVANTALILWFVAALLVYRSETDAAKESETLHGAPIDKTGKSIVFPAFLLLIAALLFVVYRFGYAPVTGAFIPATQAASELNPQRRVPLLQEAVLADPWSATLRDRLAAEYFAAWLQFLSTDTLPDNRLNLERSMRILEQESLEHQEQALRLMPRSATLRFVAAERMNAVFHKTGETTYRDQALKLYREAIDRYPNYARFRGPFALLLWESGEKDEAIRQRDMAFELDDKMPHTDQKLGDALRATLSTIR